MAIGLAVQVLVEKLCHHPDNIPLRWVDLRARRIGLKHVLRVPHDHRSLMYCVKFCDPLREKFGNLFEETADDADFTDQVRRQIQKETKKNEEATRLREGICSVRCLPFAIGPDERGRLDL